MAEARTSDGERPQRRLWSFADCIFDEGNWTLSVGGRRVAVEHKPLELLRALLLGGGNVVSKDELLDVIWPDVTVVEASLPTAIRKLRLALNDDQRETPVIETVQRIGYRLTVPVTIEESAGVVGAGATVAPAVRRWRFMGRRGLISISGIAALLAGATAFGLVSSKKAPTPAAAASAAPHYTERDAVNALRRLDVDAIERMIAAGWNPDATIGNEGSNAVHRVVEMCEWDRGHDRNRMLLMVRTLYEGGGRLDRRNIYGDTPYSIAKSPRYCGPDHPVTRSLRATGSRNGVVLDRYLASYEIARRQRR